MSAFDNKQREKALDPKRSFIVQAPAGSGKTELLIRRYLKLLAHAKAPEAIIALTFTNKAAGEMQQRIYEALLKAEKNVIPENAHQKSTFLLARKALEHADKNNWELLKNPKRMRIMTLDAFCQFLSGKLAFEAEQAIFGEVTDNPAELYHQAIEGMFKATDETSLWHDALSDVLLHLDNDIERLKALVSTMLAKREQWLSILFELGLIDTTNENAKTQIEAGFRRNLNLLLETLYQTLDLNRHKPRLIEILSYCNQGGDFNLSQEPDTLLSWQKLILLLFTRDNCLRKSFNARDGLPASEAAAKAHSNWLKDYCASFSQDQRQILRDTVSELRHFSAVSFNDKEWRILSSIAKVALHSVQFLKMHFAERGALDFNEVALQAISALGQNDAPTDLALYLDYQIEHLLIDEFQDTSVLQYRIIRLLTSEWLPDDGKTLFIVGDPMQSIYRFRQAEVNLFLDVRDNGIGRLKPEFLALSCNFRSNKTVVNWINTQFDNIFPKTDQKAYGGIRYAASKTLSTTTSDTAIHYTLFENAELEAQAIAKVIKAYQKEKPEGEIAILVRSRTHLKTLVPILKAHRIKLTENELETLFHQAQIQDLLALCFVLLNAEDVYHWVSLLQSQLFGFSLDEINFIQKSDGDFFSARIRHYLQRLEAPLPHQQKLLHFLSYLEADAFHPRRSALVKRLEIMWQKLDGTHLHQNPVLYQSFITLLNEYLSPDQSSIQNPDGFIKALNTRYATSAEQSPVNIMTIHKAKGLEFDFVILPQLDKREKTDDSELFIYDTYYLNHEENYLLMSPIKHHRAEHAPPLYQVIRAIQKKRADYERQRLLYVAVTRAKTKLYLSACPAVNKEHNIQVKEGSFLALLYPNISDWPLVQSAKPKLKDTTETALLQPMLTQVKAFNTKPFQSPAKSNTDAENVLNHPDSDSLLLSDEKQIGSLLHLMFEYLALHQGKQDDLNRFFTAMCRKLSLNKKLQEQASAMCQAAIDNTIEYFPALFRHPGFSEQDMFYLNARKVEKRTADRILIKENQQFEIIDYKFTRPIEGQTLEAFLRESDARYRPQLRQYQYLLAQKKHIDRAHIKLFLYFPLIPYLYQIPNSPVPA